MKINKNIVIFILFGILTNIFAEVFVQWLFDDTMQFNRFLSNIIWGTIWGIFMYFAYKEYIKMKKKEADKKAKQIIAKQT